MNWVSDLIKNLEQETETRPEGTGWLTFKEILADSPYSRRKTFNIINKGIELGDLERFRGFVQKSGRLCQMYWYRPIKKGKR